jgi:hypothetical protein
MCRTRPYRPRTNRKAERFIRILLDGWAYAAAFRTSHERTGCIGRLTRLVQPAQTTPLTRPQTTTLPTRAPDSPR